MIDNLFWFFINCISSIIKAIAVFMICGFILILPFLLKGGWLFGLTLYGGIILTGLRVIKQRGNDRERMIDNIMEERLNRNVKMGYGIYEEYNNKN